MSKVVPWGFPGGTMAKNRPINAGDTRDVGSISGLGRCPGGENGNLLQYSCLETLMDRAAWWVTVHRVTKSWTLLSTPQPHSPECHAVVIKHHMTFFTLASIIQL